VSLLNCSADGIGAFAAVGMGSAFAGIVRAPMTSVLIVFEMTGGYGIMLPLMIANISAFALARQSRPMPVYDALLAEEGIYRHLSAAQNRASPHRTTMGCTRAKRKMRGLKLILEV
jgi:H+/Cl- antiporter ClcA